MPRKTKEIEMDVEKKGTTKKSTKAKKTSTTAKKETKTTKVTAAKDTKKADSAKTTKKTSAKKSTSTKSTKATATTKKAAPKKSTKTTAASKAKKAPTTTKKSTSTSTRKKKVTKAEKVVPISEYYDLPQKYGTTVVKLLAQTPNTLFVYWEISDADVENFKKIYGDNFLAITTPILIVHNLTNNTSYEVEINDFANSWYLNIEDTDCKYDVELARKMVNSYNTSSSDQNTSNYVEVAHSNNIETPNNHILFEKLKEYVVFEDTGNGHIVKKKLNSFKFLKDMYKFYKEMYKDEFENNPSSGFKNI